MENDFSSFEAAVEFSFLTHDPGLEQAAWEYIRADANEQKLSRAFLLYYRFARPIMPIAIRQILQASRGFTLEQDWCEPNEFLQRLGHGLNAERNAVDIIHPWPNGADFSFVLTHDVETAEGLQNIETIAAIEEELGFRSSWNLVPHKYKIDTGIVRDLTARGFEIGIHGFNHDGCLYFSEALFRKRARAINQSLRKFNAVGFRSPMVHRNIRWLQALDIEYDASCFDCDPTQAMPGGVGSLWPFMAGRFVELPYTLPQDHTLFIALGQQDVDVWRSKLSYIQRHAGMALMLTHPDYLIADRYRDLYRDFLGEVRQQGGFWHALPREVASWWRERESCQSSLDSSGEWDQAQPAEAGTLVPATLSVAHNTILIRPTQSSVSRSTARSTPPTGR